MSLATRLSAFFLVALALVLAGFSGTLYLLARTLPGAGARRTAAAGPGHAGGVGGYRAGRARMGAGRPPDDARDSLRWAQTALCGAGTRVPRSAGPRASGARMGRSSLVGAFSWAYTMER